MSKDKRIIRRPWASRRKGGWIIQPDDLLAALKEGDIAEMGKIHVGARQLGKLIALLRFPDQELHVSTNGHLEMRNIERYIARKPTSVRTEFRKARLEHSFRVDDGAWLPKTNKPMTTVVIKPRKFA